MGSANHADVFGELETRGVVITRCCARAGDVETVRNGKSHKLWNTNIHIDADIVCIEILRTGLGNLGPIKVWPEIADGVVANQIGIAENKRMDPEAEFGICQRQQVLGIEIRRLVINGGQVTAEKR